MAQLGAAHRVYQRANSSGGGAGKGQGAVTVPVSSAVAGTINARCRSAADGVTILQPEWQAATIANGALAASIVGVDARAGWFYLDLKVSDGNWQLGTTPIGMGRLVAVGGQSLMSRFLGKVVAEDSTTLASLGISPDDNGRAFAKYTDGGTYSPAAWTKPADVGQSLGHNSAGVAELLNRQIASFGVNCGVIGYAKGATAISTWQSGQADGIELANTIASAGGAFEAFLWFQGHGDAQTGTSSYSGYKAALDSFFAYVATLNSRSFAKYLTAIPNINSVNWGNQAQRQAIRKAQEDWCAANAATYLGFADLETYTDFVHESQLGARRIARHFHRALVAEIGTDSDQGPSVTSAARSGVDITLPVAHAKGTALVGVGSPATRFLVTKAGDPAFTPLPLDGTTPITLSATQVAVKLAADPAAPVDVWPMGAHPAVQDGSASGVYDNYDPETYGRGRQLYSRPSPFHIKVNHTLNTAVSALVTAYGTGKFGQGRASGEMQATLNGLIGGIPYNGLTIEGWVIPSSINTGALNKVLVGQSGVAWIGQKDATLTFQVGDATLTVATGVTLVAGQQYHIRLCLDPGGRSWRFYVNGAQTDSGIGNPTFAIAGKFTIGGLGNSGAVGQYHYTQGVIDEVAVFNKALSTGTTYAVPSVAYAGNEADLMHLYHCNGDGVDSAA